MKSITVLLILLHYLYHSIQCAKTCNSVHGEAFEVQHETFQFKVWSFKASQMVSLWRFLFSVHPYQPTLEFAYDITSRKRASKQLKEAIKL